MAAARASWTGSDEAHELLSDWLAKGGGYIDNDEREAQELLLAVRRGAVPQAVATLLAPQEPLYFTAAATVAERLCRDLLPAFGRTAAPALLRAEQRLALARVLTAWVPLPTFSAAAAADRLGALQRRPALPLPAPSSSSSTSEFETASEDDDDDGDGDGEAESQGYFMDLLRTQIRAVESALRRPRRLILPAREERLSSWYSNAADAADDSGAEPGLLGFYRRRAYDSPRGSTATQVREVWDTAGEAEPLREQEASEAVLHRAAKESRWRLRWDGRAALFQAGVVARLVQLLPAERGFGADIAAAPQQPELEPQPEPEPEPQPQPEPSEVEVGELLQLEGKEGWWAEAEEGHAYPAGCRFSMNMTTGKNFVQVDEHGTPIDVRKPQGRQKNGPIVVFGPTMGQKKPEPEPEPEAKSEPEPEEPEPEQVTSK